MIIAGGFQRSTEKFNGFIDSHSKKIRYVFSFVFNIQDFLFESFPITIFTKQMNIGHELHFNGDFAFTFTNFTTSAFDIETEM